MALNVVATHASCTLKSIHLYSVRVGDIIAYIACRTTESAPQSPWSWYRKRERQNTHSSTKEKLSSPSCPNTPKTRCTATTKITKLSIRQRINWRRSRMPSHQSENCTHTHTLTKTKWKNEKRHRFHWTKLLAKFRQFSWNAPHTPLHLLRCFQHEKANKHRIAAFGSQSCWAHQNRNGWNFIGTTLTTMRSTKHLVSAVRQIISIFRFLFSVNSGAHSHTQVKTICPLFVVGDQISWDVKAETMRRQSLICPQIW